MLHVPWCVCVYTSVPGGNVACAFMCVCLCVCVQELASMEREIDALDRVWGLIREWQSLYASWKDGAFVDIEVG